MGFTWDSATITLEKLMIIAPKKIPATGRLTKVIINNASPQSITRI